MDKETKRNVRLGIFVITGIVLFVVGIFLIGAKDNYFTKNIRVSVLFKNVGGLAAGNYARYNGVKVGVVKTITLLNDTTVQVDMQIENSKRGFIKKEDIATIASDGLMGGKIINIVPGLTNSAPVEDNDFILSANPIGTDEMMKTLSETNNSVGEITANLQKFTKDLTEGKGILHSLIADTGMSLNLEQTFSNILMLTAQLSATSNSLDKIMNDVKTGKNSVGAILQDTAMAKNLATGISQFKTTSDKLLVISDQLSATVHTINNGNGPVAQLLTDSTMASNLDESVENIKKASAAFNENMEALKHTIFLRGYYKKQEKAKE